MGLVDYAYGPYYDFLANFDAAGNIKWSVAGYYPPSTATAGGGVIAQSYLTGQVTTFDQNGNQTGLLASLPTQSWTRNGYQFGSVKQVAFVPSNIATSFWAFTGGDASANGVAVKHEWFPSLGHCTTTPGCIGYHEAIYNALDDLKARLADPRLSALAQANIFDKLGNDANGTPLTTQSFLRYLNSRNPLFYDGTLSNYCYDALISGSTCHENASLHFLLNGEDVSSIFSKKSDITGLTSTPGYPMLTFLRPNSILFPNLA